MMLKSRIRLLVGACAMIAVLIILAITGPSIYQDRLISRYGQTASEAYVAIYRPQPVYYLLDGDGVDALARIIREDTAADPLPTRATAVLIEVVFLSANGSPNLYCSLHSLSGPKTAKTINDRMDYWERSIECIDTAKEVSCQAIEDKLGERPLYSIRRRSKGIKE